MATTKRGRPPKFGRPSRLVALTLPEDVLSSLRQVDPDPARAVVKLVETSAEKTNSQDDSKPVAELVTVGSRRSLIVVDRRAFEKLPGVSLIPISQDRAFLAFEIGQDTGVLELELIDRIDDPEVGPAETQALQELRKCLQKWRRDPELRFLLRSIIIVEKDTRRSL